MPGAQRPKWGRKARTAALTVAAHAFFVALLLVETRFDRREEAVPVPPAGQWITLMLPPLPPPPPPPETQDESTPREEVALPPPASAGPRSTAITLPPPATAPITGESPAPPPGLSANWQGQAAKLAEAYAEEMERPPAFGGPVEGMRKPCEPRVSSFWGKKKDKEDAPPAWDQVPGSTTMVGGMPIGVSGGALGGGAVGGAGIKIPLGKPEPNKHLFDDMVEGKTPASSVPHHEKCD
jgi:hypothetical protein